MILFYFNLFFCLVLRTTIIHENNEESRYVNEIIRNCQKTHVYIIWFINEQTRGFMIICKGLNTLHLYSWIKRYIEIKKTLRGLKYAGRLLPNPYFMIFYVIKSCLNNYYSYKLKTWHHCQLINVPVKMVKHRYM